MVRAERRGCRKNANNWPQLTLEICRNNSNPGRPFPLKGNYYANVFIHFEPIDPIPGMPEPEADIPPYVIPGSVWEKGK